MKFVFESGRIAEGESWLRDGWFIPWQNLAQFFAPDFFGNPTTLNYWGVWNYGELVGYIGIVPLLFSLFALFGKRTKDTVFWASAFIAALLFALPTPLAKLVYQLRVPVLSALQPTRLMVIVDFSLVMLASFGFDGWLRKKEGNRWGVILIAGIAFVVLWFVVLKGGENFQVSRRNLILPTGVFIAASFLLLVPNLLKKFKATYLVGILFIGITAVDLLRFGWKFTPFTPREYFFPETQIISFLERQEKPFRVMSLDKRILPPNVSAYYGIETIEGYDPLISGRYEELMAAVARGKPDIAPPFGFNRIITLENIDSPVLPIFNVRYVLTLEDIERPFLKKVLQEGETRVYENSRALPRVYFISEVLWVDNKEQAIQNMFDPLFDPETTAIAEGAAKGERDFKNLVNGTVNITSYLPGKIVLETNTAKESFLIISESYRSDWNVRIDGVLSKLVRINYNFMGLLVSGGAHTVEFTL